MGEHHLFDAYFADIDPAAGGALAALKLETTHIGQSSGIFVDAMLTANGRIYCIPFIRLSDGAVVFHRKHRMLSSDVKQTLQQLISTWSAGKGENGQLDFGPESQAEFLPIAREEAALRACWCLSSYQVVFDEVERYANLSAWVAGKKVLDLAAAFGVGLSSLRGIASSLAADERGVHTIYSRLSSVPRHVAASSYQPELVFRLGVNADSVDAARDELLHEFEDADILLSVRGEGGREALERAGTRALKMTRPGADALGDLDEYLGVFSDRARVFPSAPLERTGTPAIVADTPLRVLFVLRSSADQFFGGDVVQVRETVAALRLRGHAVDITTDASPDATGYDIVHLTNMTIPRETLEQAKAVERFDGAVVLMPIFTDHADETVWGMSASTAVFSSAKDDGQLAEMLQNMRNRALSVNGLPPPPVRCEMFAGYTDLQREILGRVDFVIANAHAEMHRMYRYLDCRVPYAVAPSCANAAVYGGYRREAFVKKYGLEDFVLVAGRYEARKNQVAVFEVMRSLPYPFVFIGASYDAVSASLSRAYRTNAVFLPHMPEVELAGAFAAARVALAPSWDEVVSLTSLNAALSESSIVLTRNSYEHEYLRDDAEYCDPGDIDSIAAALRRAWTSHDARAERRKALADRVRFEYSWDRSAELTEAAYYRVLAANPRRESRLQAYSR